MEPEVHSADEVFVCGARNAGVDLLGQIYEKRNNLCRTSFHNLMGHIITLILDLLTHSTVPSWFSWHDCTQQREKCGPRKWLPLVLSLEMCGRLPAICISTRSVARPHPAESEKGTGHA